MKVLAFKTAAELRSWLRKNHLRSEGVWLRLGKKGSRVASVTYAEALDQALCFGWIDGQKRTLDSASWLQRLTPRRARSRWSRRNTEHARRLIRSGQMAAAGLRAVKEAKADGRWKQAYEAFGSLTVPEDFKRALRRNPKALAFFETLDRTNLYSISYRLQTAKKAETRERWTHRIIEMLASGKKFHP